MHSRSDGTQINVAYMVPRMGGSLVLLLLGSWGIVTLARSVPDFIRRIGQPCAACDLGAFAPPLKPYGRQPEPSGNAATDGRAPIAVPGWTLFTHGQDALPDNLTLRFAPNDDAAQDPTSLPGDDRLNHTLGGFVALNDDGPLHAGTIDPGQPWAFHLLGADAPGGVPEGVPVRDNWNATPVWAAAYPRLTLPSTPDDAAWLMDDATGQPADAPRADRTWNDSRHPEIAAYRGLGRDGLNATGLSPAAGTPWSESFTPYRRVAMEKALERHFLQIGTSEMNASGLPGGDKSAGTSDSFTGMAAEANYQFIINPNSVGGDRLSAHATVIHESRPLAANPGLLGINGLTALETFRAGASFSFASTVTPSIQYFRTAGSANAVRFVSPGGRQNSAGVVAGVDFVPWSEPGSPIQFLHPRFAAQYVAYTEFSGIRRGAGGNNVLFLSLWGALHF